MFGHDWSFSFDSLSAPQLSFVQMLRIKLDLLELQCEQCLRKVMAHRTSWKTWTTIARHKSVFLVITVVVVADTC